MCNGRGNSAVCMQNFAQKSRFPYDAIVRNWASQNICGQAVTPVVFLLPETPWVLWCDPIARAGPIGLAGAKLFPS